MNILDITEKALPFFQIMSRTSDGEWTRFSLTPFATPEEAEKKREEIAAELGVDRDRLRVFKYDEHDWRYDLITLIIKDGDANRRCLSVLRSSTLVDALR